MKSGVDERKRANETAACFMPEEIAQNDRAQFVENLGWLLAQTRDGVQKCELEKPSEGEEYVIVTYKGGSTRRINVFMDSYAAIVRDVAKQFQ